MGKDKNMKVKPKENRLLIMGTDVKVMIHLNPKQVWEKRESKVPGTFQVERGNAKLCLASDVVNDYFV